MRIIEFLPENKLKNLQIDREYDREHTPVSQPQVLPKQGPKYYIVFNGKPWTRKGALFTFDNEGLANKSAKTLSDKMKGRVRIEVRPLP